MTVDHLAAQQRETEHAAEEQGGYDDRFKVHGSTSRGLMIRTPVERFAESANPSGLGELRGRASRRETGSGRGVGNPVSFRGENETDGIRLGPTVPAAHEWLVPRKADLPVAASTIGG
ncbi:hypothetical protein GCM10008019_03760 [Deinococcus soli (ex Cha et al. 2016)]|nr:hypothetical protein GCM10008019_03760 [Deinococcus soli (ex Cha et al. 2016)]